MPQSRPAARALAAADQALDPLHLRAVDLARPLVPQELLDVPSRPARPPRPRPPTEQAVVLGGEVGEADGVGVEDGDVPARLVGDVDLVPLVDQADQGAAHADHVVVGVGAEDQDPLGEHVVGRAGDVAGPLAVRGLAAGPAGDRLRSARNTSRLMPYAVRRPGRPAGPAGRARCSPRRSASGSASSPGGPARSRPCGCRRVARRRGRAATGCGTGSARRRRPRPGRRRRRGGAAGSWRRRPA